MYTSISTSLRRSAIFGILGISCILGSFTLGIISNSELTAELTAAEDVRRGDVDQDGKVDVADAILILEIVQGYRAAAPAARRADPDGNGHLTVDDAIRILRQSF